MTVHRESVFAVRDTELIQFPARLLHHIKRLNPNITEHVIRHICRDAESDQSSPRAFQDAESEIKYQIQAEKLANISTIAVACSDENCPIDCFIDQLRMCLSPHGKVICLSSNSVEKTLGRFALTDRGSAKLIAWLANQEENHKISIFKCDIRMTPWSRQCLRQADAVLIVSNGSSKPTIGIVENQLNNYSVRAVKILVLLHKTTSEDSLSHANIILTRILFFSTVGFSLVCLISIILDTIMNSMTVMGHKLDSWLNLTVSEKYSSVVGTETVVKFPFPYPITQSYVHFDSIKAKN